MRFLTGGESHGDKLIGIIEGFPKGLYIDLDTIKKDLRRRNLGIGRGIRARSEKDEIQIVGGIYKNITTGAPIVIEIKNSLKYGQYEAEEKPIYVARAGHADLIGVLKYGFDEITPVIERASARETAIRTAIGSLAKIFLKEFKVHIYSQIVEVKNIKTRKIKKIKSDAEIDEEFPFYDVTLKEKAVSLIKEHEKRGETLGGKILVTARNVIPGIGSYIHFDKRLDAKISYYLMSIPSVKGLLIGEIEKTYKMDGSKAQDYFKIIKDCFFKRKTNYSGGIEGGMSNGEDINIYLFVKPLPSSRLSSIGLDIKEKSLKKPLIPRADTTSLVPVSVISEAMLAIVLMEGYLDKFGGDTMEEIKNSFREYKKRLK